VRAESELGAPVLEPAGFDVHLLERSLVERDGLLRRALLRGGSRTERAPDHQGRGQRHGNADQCRVPQRPPHVRLSRSSDRTEAIAG